jgi:ammonium transporter, Amt family
LPAERLEYALRGKPSVLGFCSGALGGLVVITPACGYVDPTGAIIIGVAAGIVPFFACTKLKSWLGYDDALDTLASMRWAGHSAHFSPVRSQLRV